MRVRPPRRLMCLWGLALALLACRPTPTPPAQPSYAARSQLALWHVYHDKPRQTLDNLVAAWNQHHPDAEVRSLPVAVTELTERVRQALPELCPDLIVADGATLAELAGVLAVEPEQRLARFEPELLAPLRLNGVVLGLPLDWQLEALYYNPRLVPTPPAHLPQLLDAAARTGAPALLACEAADLYGHAPWLHAAGGALSADAAQPWATPQAVEAMRQARAVVLAARMGTDDSRGDELTARFVDGKVPFVIAGPDFGRALGPDVRWTVAPLPRWADGQPMQPLLRVDAVARTRHARPASEAFVDFLTSDEAALARLTQARQLPPNRKVYENPRWLHEPWVKAFRAGLRDAVPLPAGAGSAALRGLYGEALRRAVLRDTDPAIALAQADAQRVVLRPPMAHRREAP